MNKQIKTSYNISGQIQGLIWMPCVDCTKQFNKNFTKEQNEPFKYQIENLRDALLNIINDGDFRDVVISEAFLTVEKDIFLNGKFHKSIRKTKELNRSGENKDLFCKEEEIIYPELGEY